MQDIAQPAAAELETAAEFPRVVRALRNPGFRNFWAGNFLSNIGTWMQNVAMGWLVITKEPSNPAYWLGVVGFVSSAPMLVFALIGGVIADHTNKRRLLMITQAAMMVFALALAFLTWRDTITIREIVWLSLLTGIAMSLNAPAYQALVPRLVPRDDLVNAIALNSAQFNMSRVIGPTVGGYAMAWFGMAGNFLLNGVSFFAVLIALTRIRYREELLPEEGGLWDRLKQGFRYVFSHRDMVDALIVVTLASLLAIPYITFVPLFARNVLDVGERGLGVLMAASGLGAFLGAATIAYLGRIRNRGRFILTWGAAFFVAIIGFSLSQWYAVSLLMQVAAGYSMILMVATINTYLQHASSDEMRGRVMSIYATAFLGLPPVGSLVAGLLAREFTAPNALAGMSALALLGMLAVYIFRPEFRRLD